MYELHAPLYVQFEVGLTGCRINFIDIDPGASVLRVDEFEFVNPSTLGWVDELRGLTN